MDARYLNVGDRIDYTPASAVAAGEVVVVGKVSFVANAPIAANELGSLAARGVFEVAKTDGLAISLGDAVYWNDTTNKATKTSSDVYMGVAVAAAAAGDSTVRVLLRSLQEALADPRGLAELTAGGTATATEGNLLIGDGDSFEAGKAGPKSLATVADGASGIPILIRKACVASGAEDVTVLASAPVKLLVTDAWMIARDTNAANVKLHSGTAGTDDITEAKAKGTADNAIVRFGTIVAAKDEIATSGAIKANFSAAGAADVFVLAVPIA